MKPTLLSATCALLVSCSLIAQGDCPGETICTTQNDELTAGSINEIDSSNCGTLPAYEADYSFWYMICVNGSGTIAFAINPFGAGNDYDFAVWGPHPDCAPGTQPLRSSSATTPASTNNNADKTGLGQGNNDFLENGSGNGWLAPINALAGECYLLCINRYVAGTNSFNIQFDGTAILSCTPLPVTLTSFTCIAEESGVHVSWTCETETNNWYFIVERTTDGINYEHVAVTMGAGTCSFPTAYHYFDDTAPQGTVYYRLRQIDYNGTETEYGPVSSEYTPSGSYVMEIISVNGQIVFSGETSNYKQTLTEQNLDAGIYLISLTRGTARHVTRHAVTQSIY